MQTLNTGTGDSIQRLAVTVAVTRTLIRPTRAFMTIVGLACVMVAGAPQMTRAQGIPHPVAAKEAADEKAVRAVLQEWLDALLHGDMKELERIIAPDYTITVSDGRVLNRDEDLEVVKNGRVRFQAAAVDSVHVRIFGEAAVVTGIGRYAVTMDDKTSTIRERFTDIYAKREGRWQPVASHTTPLRN